MNFLTMVLFYSLVKPCRSLALLLLFSTLSPSAFAAESQPEYGAGEVPNQVDLEEQDRAENPGSEDKNATRKAVEAKAPKLLLLPIYFDPKLKLGRDRQISFFFAIKNASRREGSFRVRTLKDLELEAEELHRYAKICRDDSCLYEALANTELPHFLRVAVRAADGGAVAVSVVAHSVEHRRAYQPVEAVYRSQEGGTSAVQVARSRIARLIRLGVWSLPPPRLPDGSPPVADSALIVEAPQGAFISVDGVVRGEISEHNMTRIELQGATSYQVKAEIEGLKPDEVKVDLGAASTIRLKLEPSLSGTAEQVVQTLEDRTKEQPKAKKRNVGRLVVKMKVKPGADVYLDGEWIGENPLTYDQCPVGRHRVVVRHPLYYRLKRNDVLCRANRETRVEASMLPRYGRIKVQTKPSGAGVLLDGDPVGKTPLVIDEVTSGTHRVQIQDDRFESPVRRVKVVEHQTASVWLPLRKRFGYLQVKGYPKDLTVSGRGRKIKLSGGEGILALPPGRTEVTCSAPFYKPVKRWVRLSRGQNWSFNCGELQAIATRLKVYDPGHPGRLVIDGKVVARVPAEVAIEPGKHIVEVRPDAHSMKGYRTEVIVADQDLVEIRPKFVFSVGGLKVGSQPAGATVYLDGKEIGQTPLEKKDLPTGIYVLEIKLKGYDPYGRRLGIGENEVVTIDAPALKRRGVLRVEVQPAGATIFVGGRPMGRSPLELDDLPYGFYDVVAKREGWTERSVEVEVKDGEETVIRLKPMRPLSLVNAPFYDRVHRGRLLLFGGLGLVAAGAGSYWGGQQLRQSAPDLYGQANDVTNREEALGFIDRGRNQDVMGQGLIQFSGLMGLVGVAGVGSYLYQFPWGDL